MEALVLGLILFLGVHSVRIVADDWRSQTLARWGEPAWKGGYSVVSVLGLGLIVWGYGQARLHPQVLWASPIWTRHLAALLVLVAMVLLVAAYVPRNAFKLKLQHPMVLSVKLWAAAHLLANNTLADVLLFGGFLVWAVADFRRARRRSTERVALEPSAVATGLTVAMGALVWAGLAFWGHAWLFGVAPFGAITPPVAP